VFVQLEAFPQQVRTEGMGVVVFVHTAWKQVFMFIIDELEQLHSLRMG
jgi:hypothetical protein